MLQWIPIIYQSDSTALTQQLLHLAKKPKGLEQDKSDGQIRKQTGKRKILF